MTVPAPHPKVAAPRGRVRALALLGASAVALAAGAAEAQSPQGGVVVKGAARIAQTAARSTITQTSRRAVIDWQGFDVGRDHRVVFDQPGRNAATLNRVDSARASVIEGRVSAPGTVIVQNTAGVLFTESARVDVGGLVASSQVVDAARFQADGRLRIGGGERPDARVVNRGELTIGEAGLAALVGGDVENAGVIVARKGTVALASGERTTIDLGGDGVVRIAVAGDGSGGAANSGLIDAGGGRVLMTAGGAARALDGVINTSGVIRAASTQGDGGRIELVGRGEGTVRVSGTLDASGADGGGSVTVTGESVELRDGARVAARGGVDGGAVRIGGGRRGGGPLPRARDLSVAAGAEIAADGGSGVGGSVVAWSDRETVIAGRISATGDGGGGFVETSGRLALGIARTAEVLLGRGGRWLLDPRDVTIGNTGAAPGGTPPGTTPFEISRIALAAALNDGADVTVTTVEPGSSMAGDITVTGPVVWNGPGDLRLVAERDIRLDGQVTTNGGDFAADAARSLIVNRSVQANGAASIGFTARTGDVRITQAATGNVTVSTASGRLSLDAPQGWVDLRRLTPQSASNVQVYSASGRVDIAAGAGILLAGGTQGGRWVRVGRTGDSSAISLTAPLVKIYGGTAGDAFAEVVAGAGGSITVAADELRVRNEGTGSEGRILALNGADLTLNADQQVWNGPVRAGTGGSDGGDVELSGAITALVQPRFSLAPGRGFTLAPASPDGTRSTITSGVPLAVSTSGTGAIDLGGRVEAPQVTLVSLAQVLLRQDAGVTGTGSGDAVVIAAGGSFDNRAGVAGVAASDPDARWLVYIDRFDGRDGAAPEPRGFDLYGRPFASTPPSSIGLGSNRIVYGESPVLTVTAESLRKSYGADADPGYTIAGLRPGDDLGTAIDYVEVTSSGAPATARVGRYATRATAIPSAQGYVLSFVDGTLAVDPALLTVEVNDASRSYGGANPRFSADIEGFVLGDDASILDGSLALRTTATRESDAGRYAITGSGLEVPDGNYRLSYREGTLNVVPAPLTVTANDAARSYGGADPAFGARFDGFVLGEGADVLGGALDFSTDATRRSPVGRYAVSPGGLTSGNYAISFADGALSVTPAPLTVTANDAARSYGAANPDFTARYDGLVLGEGPGDLGALDFATDANRRSDAGSYRVTPGGLTSGNYAVTYAPGTLTVDPAPLTVTTNDASRTYGALNPAFTATLDGFVLGEDIDALGGALDFATDADPASPAGRYAVTPGGLTSGNYAISYAPGTLTVDRATLTVTTTSASKTYGSANPDFAATVDGFVLGEGLGELGGDLSFTTDANRRSDVGEYAVTPGGLTGGGNYAIDFVDGALTVDPAPLTVTANDASRTFGSLNPDFSARFDGFVLGEDASVLGGDLRFDTPATRQSDVGTYRVTPEGLTSGNYAISYDRGTLSVDPAPLTVTANDATRTYGAANPDFSARFDGFVLGQDTGDLEGALDFETAATRRSGVGAYDVTAGGLASGNYAISYAPGTLTVDRAPLTVTANDASRTYGASNPDFSARVDGFVLGEGLNELGGALDFDTNAGRRSDVGSYAVTPGGLTGGGNYAIDFVDGALTVDPAPLTMTANDASRTYGAANPDFTARYDGFVLGEGAGDLGGDLGFDTNAGRSSDVGSYRLTPEGLTSGNYAISYGRGTLTVDPAPLTVAVADASRTYGGANPNFTARFDGFVLGEGAGDLDGVLDFETAATRRSGVGAYDVTAGGLASGNYAISYTPGTLTVDRAPLTVTANNASRTYGASNPDFSARVDGFVLGEGRDVLAGTLDFTSQATRRSDVGSYAVTPGGLTGGGNYAIDFVDGALTVDPAPLRVTANDASRTYGASNPDFSARFDGFVLGEGAGDLGGTLGFDTNAGRGSDVGRYRLTPEGLTSGNYAISYGRGTLTVDPAPLRVTTNDASRTYGAGNPDFSARFDGLVLGEGAGDLDGALAFDTAATRRSGVGAYDVGVSGLTSGNYAISYAPGTLTVDAAPLTVTTNDASRLVGDPNPPFSASFDGFVLGEDPGDLDGALSFATDATPASAAGDYAITPGGLGATNYAISFVDGTLTVAPQTPVPGPGPADALGRGGVEPYARGVPPLTPGDASFRTTVAEAPPALANPFDLTYSLGEIVQLAPEGSGDGSGGFVPAAGGDTAEAPAGNCSGPINRGAPTQVCARQTVEESYWTTTGGESN